MEEKNSGFSLNRRLLRALRRRARGEGGVTLVEMMVSLFIFAIVSRLTLVTTDADGIRQCAVIEYTEATWSGGRVDDYGSVVVKTRPYATGAGGAWSEHAVLTAVMNNSTASTSDDSLFKNKLFSMDGGTCVVRYSPVTGSYVGGKPVTSNTLTSFTARNVGSSASVDFSQCR